MTGRRRAPTGSSGQPGPRRDQPGVVVGGHGVDLGGPDGGEGGVVPFGGVGDGLLDLGVAGRQDPHGGAGQCRGGKHRVDVDRRGGADGCVRPVPGCGGFQGGADRWEPAAVDVDIEGLDGLTKTVKALRTKTYNDNELLAAIMQLAPDNLQTQLRKLYCDRIVGSTRNYCTAGG